MDCSLPGSSVHLILQARILEWVAMPSSRGSSWPRDRTHVVSYVSCNGRQVLYHIVFQSFSHILLFWDPMGCSTEGFPVFHQFPELAQTHVLWVGDATQPSCPLSSPSPPAFNLSQHQGLFQWVSSLVTVTMAICWHVTMLHIQWGIIQQMRDTAYLRGLDSWHFFPTMKLFSP